MKMSGVCVCERECVWKGGKEEWERKLVCVGIPPTFKNQPIPVSVTNSTLRYISVSA